MWIKNIRISKLTLKMFLSTLAAIAVSICIYSILTFMEVRYIDHLLRSSSLYHEQITDILKDFQNYVTDSGLSLSSREEIRAWDKKHSVLDMQLIHDDAIIYDSLDYLPAYNYKSGNIYNIIYVPSKRIIHFSDGDAAVYTSPLYTQRLERRMDYGILIISFLTFCLLLVWQLHRLVRDIVKIDKGIRRLESGDLSYRITVSRNDEIEDLAESINRISREIARQNEDEERLRKSNYDMVTAVSHDIRTPLTSVIGYAELIREPGMEEDKKQTYLEKIIDRSYLIKDMTDHLFQHFVTNSQEIDYHFEVITGNDFVTYVMNTMAEGLSDRDFSVKLHLDIAREFFMKVDTTQIRRVFNNLEGNLLKYADRSFPILYEAYLTENQLTIVGQNHIVLTGPLDSHGVGMRNCTEILGRHEGTLETFSEQTIFYTIIKLPVYNLQDLEGCGT